ncbi:MAG: sulfite exporter TauE/SafE family protein [Salaquimonas sp.]
MIEQLAAYVDLTTTELLICIGVITIAGIVRGFSGFALSALIMAGLVVIIPPIHLIPVCFMLEAVASAIMVRGGMKDADMKIVWGLVIGSAIGTPIGLYATNTLPIETSKLVALCVLMALAIAQLMRLRFAFLATFAGLYISGLLAGIVSGLASIGGMVVALYVLSQDIAAKKIRASLVMFLFIGIVTSSIYLYLYDMLTILAVKRSLVFSPLVISGVLIGSWIFRPSLESFYKRFCLVLLIGLAGLSLIRIPLS